MALLARNRPGTLYAAFNACNLWKTGPEAARACAARRSC